MIGEWEMSGLDMSGEGAFASPTPGAAMHRFTSTIKHKGTGKECKDGVDIVEWFFDKDGKCSGGKFFWGNAKGVAATYPPMPAPPPAVTAFFDGKPMAGKVEALPTLLDEALVVEFIGPYAGATTGLKLDKPKMMGTAPTRTLTLTLAPAPTPTPTLTLTLALTLTRTSTPTPTLTVSPTLTLTRHGGEARRLLSRLHLQPEGRAARQGRRRRLVGQDARHRHLRRRAVHADARQAARAREDRQGVGDRARGLHGVHGRKRREDHTRHHRGAVPGRAPNPNPNPNRMNPNPIPNLNTLILTP